MAIVWTMTLSSSAVFALSRRRSISALSSPRRRSAVFALSRRRSISTQLALVVSRRRSASDLSCCRSCENSSCSSRNLASCEVSPLCQKAPCLRWSHGAASTMQTLKRIQLTGEGHLRCSQSPSEKDRAEKATCSDIRGGMAMIMVTLTLSRSKRDST